ncbi:hypothetical protein GE09DRAFT_717753 [Coniochaeta sp. 2T2.1]|nr:hypothetical protein GE09DRAFT_717753 [Coniochaeta sp. 2T2.1]
MASCFPNRARSRPLSVGSDFRQVSADRCRHGPRNDVVLNFPTPTQHPQSLHPGELYSELDLTLPHTDSSQEDNTVSREIIPTACPTRLTTVLSLFSLFSSTSAKSQNEGNGSRGGAVKSDVSPQPLGILCHEVMPSSAKAYFPCGSDPLLVPLPSHLPIAVPGRSPAPITGPCPTYNPVRVFSTLKKVDGDRCISMQRTTQESHVSEPH